MNTVASSTRPICILVLGMHRSGTSALTRCLNLVGMDLGSHLLSPKNMNAKGFWEHADAVRINDELLEALGLLWHSLDPLPDGWLTSAAADAARAEIRVIVQRDFDGVPLWGLKDPRLCRLAPLWIEVLQEIGVKVVSVFMMRSPLEVGQSLHHTHRLSVPHGVLLWMQHLQESVFAAHSIPRVMVDYEHLLSEPSEVVSKIGRELRLVWPIPPSERLEAIAAFLDVGLRTQRKSVSAEQAPPLVTELVQACDAIVDNPSPAQWLHLTTILARVKEQIRTLHYLGTTEGFVDRGLAILRAELTGWVPNAVLYYATDEAPAFSEDRRIAVPVPWGRNHLDLTLPATAEIPVRLRFDPLDRRGAYMLHSLVLFDRFGQVAWDWPGAGDGVELVSIDLMPSQTGAGRLVAYTGDDPQICIELPRSIADRRVTMVRVDMECLDAGALSDEILAQAARAETYAEDLRHVQLAQEQALEMQRGRDQLRVDQLTEQSRSSTEASRREIERLMAIQLTQARELQAIHTSVTWRVMIRLRGVVSRVPVGLRRQLRRVLKAAWWCITPWRLPMRLQFLRQRRAMQAWQQPEALHAASPRPVNRPAVLSFVPAGDSAPETAAGHYQLSHGDPHYTYVPPRPPASLEQEIATMSHAPRFSIIVPVYNTPSGLLDKLVSSVLVQWYPHWELILINDNSSLEHVRVDLDRLCDSRIIVVHLTENKRIALATNAGIARAGGDYVVFADHDDELTPDCLYELVRCIEREKPDFIYSDEDKIDERGQYVQPFFKPGWSPDTIMSTMYTCHVSCVRRELVNELGGLRPEYDGCQDWDLVLRVVEKTDRIAHIPKVLYHWRIIPASVASSLSAKPHVIATSKRVREEAITRRGLIGVMEPVEEIPGYFRAVYQLRDDRCISIVIQSKNNHRALKRCIDSIESKSTYRNFEIVIIDHGSTDPASVQYVEALSGNARIKVLSYDKPFNQAAINNFGVQTARGELLLFLNDSVEVLVPDWLERLGGYAQLPHVGAVGVKLLNPGGTVLQQVGVVNLFGGPGYGFSGLSAQEHGYFARAVLEYNWLAVTSACLMVERSKFERVGGFDEGFPTSRHDIELCFRLVESGYYNLVSPAVRLISHEPHGHESDNTNPEQQAETKRETHFLYQKHPQFYKYDPFHNPNLAPNDERFGLPQ
jgi:glycosyltransferase involved in cell wall biosynthesis